MQRQSVPIRTAHRPRTGHALLVACIALAFAAPASGETLASASFRIVGSHLNGGGGVDLQAAAPGAQVASAGVSIGQSPPLGSSPDMVAGSRVHAPGFWPIASIASAPSPILGAVPALSGVARWLLACAFALAAFPALRRRAGPPGPRSRGRAFLRWIFTARAGRQR